MIRLDRFWVDILKSRLSVDFFFSLVQFDDFRNFLFAFMLKLSKIDLSAGRLVLFPRSRGSRVAVKDKFVCRRSSFCHCAHSVYRFFKSAIFSKKWRTFKNCLVFKNTSIASSDLAAFPVELLLNQHGFTQLVLTAFLADYFIAECSGHQFNSPNRPSWLVHLKAIRSANLWSICKNSILRSTWIRSSDFEHYPRMILITSHSTIIISCLFHPSPFNRFQESEILTSERCFTTRCVLHPVCTSKSTSITSICCACTSDCDFSRMPTTHRELCVWTLVVVCTNERSSSSRFLCAFHWLQFVTSLPTS